MTSLFQGTNRRLTYTAFFGLSFLVFLYLLFPYEIFLPTLLKRIEPQLSPDHSLAFETSALQPYWLTGFSLRNFKLKKNNQPVFEADPLRIRLRVLPLLMGIQSVGFSANTYGGKLSGTAGRKKLQTLGSIHLEKISLQKIPYLTQDLHLPISGTVSGESTYLLIPGKPQESSLKGEFILEKGRLGPGQIYGFDLPNALKLEDQAGPAKLKFNLEKGILVPSFKISNSDGKIELNGEIKYFGDFRASPMDLQLTFGLADKVREDFPAFLFTLPPMVAARNSDNSFTFRVQGSLFQAQWTPFKRL